jgi:hypothetical protein
MLRSSSSNDAAHTILLLRVVVALWSALCLGSCHGFAYYDMPRTSSRRAPEASAVRLSMSLKPAALPLMEAGKTLARSGELLIDATSAMDLYGGSLSTVGAMLRNCGDCVAQAGASMRFKTSTELVIDELREGATCLKEATDKMSLAAEEAVADQNESLAREAKSAVAPITTAASFLEESGAGIMKKVPLTDIGSSLVTCGESLEELSDRIKEMGPGLKEASESAQRMAAASKLFVEAGQNLCGIKKDKPKGKAWLQG